MAQILLNKWMGFKYAILETCDVTILQDLIVLKFIQNYNCRISSPKFSAINISTGYEEDKEKKEIFNNINGLIINVSDKKNWIIKNNVLFLRITVTKHNKEINFMIINSKNLINISEDNIYSLIKDCLLELDYEVDW